MNLSEISLHYMDNKQFITSLSKKTGMEYKECQNYVAALCDIIVMEIEAGRKVAIPSFGQFSPDKQDETISRDLTTGKNIMLPPSIVLKFTAGSILSKRVNI